MIRFTTLSAGVSILLLLNIIPDSPMVHGQSPGFFLDEWQEKTAVIPAHEAVEKPASSPTVNVTVNSSNAINKVPQYIYGNNAVTWDNGLSKNSTAMTDLNNLDPHVLRWPGGNLSNVYFWNSTYNNRPADVPDYLVNDHGIWYGQDCPDWQQSVDEYYDLLDNTNSTGIICVNYSYARYGTGPDPVANAAHMAAEWVRYDNGRSKFWEIGNENFGNWQAGYEIDVTQNKDGQPRFISGQLYGQHCRVFIDSMRAAASEIGVDIKIGVVAYDAENSWDPISQDWNEGMMPEVGNLADFLIVHSYFTPYNENSSVSTILNSHVVPGEIMEAIEADMAEAEKTMLPVAMTEWNIFAVGSMQQVSYVNGMLAAITLGEYVKHNYGLSTRWDLVNGWSNGNDHGLFSTGGEPGVDPYNPRAVFFYMYYHQEFFGDRMVESVVSGNSNIIAHASTFTSGETGLVLVNKGGLAETAEIEIDGSYGIQYYYYTLTGGDDNGEFSRKVLINGIEDPNEDGGGPDNYRSIKARASNTFGGIIIDLPPHSVVYAIIDKQPSLSYVYSRIDTNAQVIDIFLSEDIIETTNASGFEVLINGSVSAVITGIESNADDASILHLYLDNEIMHGDVVTISYSGAYIGSLENGTPLEGFTEKTVENLLPGDPIEFNFLVKHSTDDAVIGNCQVTFNGETKLTDENGQVYFSAATGQYTVSAEKIHLDPITSQPVEILESTTTIALFMDSTDYIIEFLVTDTDNGDPLPSTTVSYGSQSASTNQQGTATLLLNAGTRTISFSKLNFAYLESEVEVESNGSNQVELTRTHAEVKLRIRSGEQPVTGAEINLSGETMTTNLVGTAVFPSVEINTAHAYSIEKEYFFTLEGSINVTTDTSVNLQMEKSVANIIFRISSATGTLLNACAVIESDTAWFDEDDRAIFYNMQLFTEYQYSIAGDNFETVTGSIFLENDSTVQVLLSPNVLFSKTGTKGLRIFPNPAKSRVFIAYDDGNIREIEIMDITGKQVFQREFEFMEQETEIDLPFSSGIYFVRVRSNHETYSSHLIIR